MKKVFFVLAACAVVSAALVGCGSSSSPESQSVATSDNAVAQNKGDIGPYHFEISDTARTEEITEGTALIVKYTITNNSDETITPGSVTRLQVFQNGVSLSGITIIGAENGALMDNEYKSIQQGASIEVEKQIFLLLNNNRFIDTTLLYIKCDIFIEKNYFYLVIRNTKL